MKWFTRKTVWLPTWPVSIGAVIFATVIGWIAVKNVYGFLAVDDFEQTSDAEVALLVVEGWVGDSVIDETARIFREGEFDRIGATGGPITGMRHMFDFETYAEFAAFRLIEAGVPGESVLVASAYDVNRRRTQRSALDLQTTLADQRIAPAVINVVTADVHARRTRMIYRRVFGDEVEIGVKGVAPDDYEAARWWSTSEGIKTIAVECLSLIYDGLSPTTGSE